MLYSRRPLATLAASVFALGLTACDKKEPEPAAKAETTPKPSTSTDKLKSAAKIRKQQRESLATRLKKAQERRQMQQLAKKKVVAKPVAKVPVSEGDPVKGKWTLADATKGLPSEGVLVATIKTGKGDFTCELYEDKAPITVANFVGLARGLRPWKEPEEGKWVKKPAYDGTIFHRVIKGFMIQGGDPAGTGSGGKHQSPGYVIPDEIWDDAHHDTPGQLCMANRGPNTNGAQFFIMDGKAPHLDNGYTIFGLCEPADLVTKIASAERRGQRPVDPVKIEKVSIARDKNRKKAEPKKADAEADKKADAKSTADGGSSAPATPAASAK